MAKVAEAIAPIIAVPTTAGTGSEVGRAGVLTHDITHEKKIIFHPKMMPGIVMIGAGTLDDSSWLKPAMQIYCDSAQPWVQLGGGLQSFARMPTQG